AGGVAGTLVPVTTVRGDVALRQGEHDGHAWAMALRRPDPSLDGIVAGPFCGYEESGREVRRRQTATDRVPVIISFGDPIDLVSCAPRAPRPGASPRASPGCTPATSSPGSP